MALKLICFASPCESPSNIESISRKPYDTQGERTGITVLLADLRTAGIRFRDLHTTQSSLEDIFVDVVRRGQ
jgi:hypothetical protein